METAPDGGACLAPCGSDPLSDSDSTHSSMPDLVPAPWPVSEAASPSRRRGERALGVARAIASRRPEPRARFFLRPPPRPRLTRPLSEAAPHLVSASPFAAFTKGTSASAAGASASSSWAPKAGARLPPAGAPEQAMEAPEQATEAAEQAMEGGEQPMEGGEDTKGGGEDSAGPAGAESSGSRAYTLHNRSLQLAEILDSLPIPTPQPEAFQPEGGKSARGPGSEAVCDEADEFDLGCDGDGPYGFCGGESCDSDVPQDSGSDVESDRDKSGAIAGGASKGGLAAAAHGASSRTGPSPPGAPNAEAASEAVAAAVQSAGSRPTDSRRLLKPAAKATGGWRHYSLDGVKRLTSAENAHIASNLLESLRGQGVDGAAADGACGQPEGESEGAGFRPKFRMREERCVPDPAPAPSSGSFLGAQTPPFPAALADCGLQPSRSAPGAWIAQTCVAGQAKRPRGAAPSEKSRDERGPPRAVPKSQRLSSLSFSVESSEAANDEKGVSEVHGAER